MRFRIFSSSKRNISLYHISFWFRDRELEFARFLEGMICVIDWRAVQMRLIDWLSEDFGIGNQICENEKENWNCNWNVKFLFFSFQFSSKVSVSAKFYMKIWSFFKMIIMIFKHWVTARIVFLRNLLNWKKKDRKLP